MTYKDKHTINRNLIDNFLPVAVDANMPKHDKLLVINEISRMCQENDTIKKMKPKDMMSPIELVTVEIPSSINGH